MPEHRLHVALSAGQILAGCSCGTWSTLVDRGSDVTEAWQAHLDDDDLAGPTRQQLAFALQQACMKLATVSFRGTDGMTLADESDRWRRELVQIAKAARP